MKKLRVNVGGGYDILIARGLLDTLGTRLRELGYTAAAVVTDKTVDSLYGERTEKSLEAAGLRTCRHAFEGGEESKSLKTVEEILESLSGRRLTRSDCVVALGGGISGDVAGFCASVYQRGTAFVQVPTTLLAAVDSSVGGKTGVNLRSGKNLAGAFWQPELVLCDTDFLSTLSPQVFSDGMAEVVKYGLLEDASLFEALAGGSWEPENMIFRCVGIKARYVEADERDLGQRQKLNLGHTFAHAIEKASGYAVTHGRAVAIGMVMASRAAKFLSVAEESCTEALERLLAKHGLPVSTRLPPAALLEAMTGDKKRAGGELTLVLPRRVGDCVLKKAAVEDLPEILDAALGRD